MARSPSDRRAASSSAAARKVGATAARRAAGAPSRAARQGPGAITPLTAASSPAPAPAAAPPPAPTPADSVVRLVVVEGSSHRELVGEAAIAELPKAMRRRSARLWIDVCGANHELKNRISETLGLHPLLAEDIVEREQRAKLEQVDDLLHVVVFSLGLDDGDVYERELDFVLGERFLLSHHSRWWDPRATRHLRAGPAEALAKGTGHLLWCLADDVIDSYFPILDQLGDEIDALEDQVVARADRALLERLFSLKRQLIRVRRVTSPEREMFNILSNREEKAIRAEDRLYFRDAYDHLIRLTDELDTYRELASATLEAYLSTVNNNLSLIMKRLTGVTVVVAGVGAIAGIFGMSEAQTAWRLDEGFGFWLVTFGSLVLAGGAVAVLHQMDWI